MIYGCNQLFGFVINDIYHMILKSYISYPFKKMVKAIKSGESYHMDGLCHMVTDFNHIYMVHQKLVGHILYIRFLKTI